MASPRPLLISEITLDPSLQPRESMNTDAVKDYAEALRALVDDPTKAGSFPALTVFFDGEKYWLADGFHRLLAHQVAGLTRAHCLVNLGDYRKALLHSIGANAQHGLRRTNADKRRAVEKLLADEEWGGWSDHEIARRANVSHTLVAEIRKDCTSNVASDPARKDRNGRLMNTANIGRKSRKQNEVAGDEASNDIPPDLQQADTGEAGGLVVAPASPDSQPITLPAGGEAAGAPASVPAAPPHKTRLVGGGMYSQEELVAQPEQVAAEMRHELELLRALEVLAKGRIPAGRFDKLCPPCLRRSFDEVLEPAFNYLEALRFDWTFGKELEDAEPRPNHKREVERANADPAAGGRHTAPQRGRML